VRFNQRLLFSFDWFLLLIVLALTAIGLVAIWSTTNGSDLDRYFGRQMVYVGLGLLAFLVILYFDYHVYSDFVSFAYSTGLVLLLIVLVAGHSTHGNKSWLQLGKFQFQPSEVVKFVTLVALAKYYSETEREQLELRELVTGGLIVLIPMVLVDLQGDRGTAVTFLPIYAALSYLAGVKRKHIVVILLTCLLAAPAGWMVLRDYQKGRIETVFDPSSDPRGLGYQALQSEIAIGAGRFLGKGFRQGSQGQLGFLPARHTDFVFAAWAEERGFIGGMTLLGLLLLMSLRLLKAAREAKDRIGTMIVVGVLATLLFHVMINVGMVVGLLPIAGIPLPFVSAGGSSLISCFIAVGLCMNIRMRRYVN
jgi:rod shape determining protein RodA